MPEAVRIPWLHDRHTHVTLYAALSGNPSVAGMGREEALAVLRSLPADRLSVVSGWSGALAPLRPEERQGLAPAIVLDLSLHGYTLTDAALPFVERDPLGIVPHRADPVWAERNLGSLLELYGGVAQLDPAKLDAFMGRLEGQGIFSADDMLVTGEEALEVVRRSRFAGRIRFWASPAGFGRLGPAAREAIFGLKLFTDGALGTRTAALRDGYLDGGKGLLLYEDEALESTLGECQQTGKPVAVHAIGDAALEQVLGALERLERAGARFPSVRIEHAQLIDRAQARRARELGVVLSMQPNFSSDSRAYVDRLRPEQLAANNPFRMLIDEVGFVPGRDLVFGSDGMPHGVEYALQWSLFPDYPGQRLEVRELVAGYGTSGEGASLLEVDPAARRVTLVSSCQP